MNSPVRVGLVGIGGFGQRHLNTLSTLQSGGLCRIIAIADPFASRHTATVAALRSMNIEVLEDISELVARDEIEACVIATPIPLHTTQTLKALESGKHVYLEKPPCVTLDEWSQLRQGEQESGKKCAVGFQMQATPAIRFLKEQLCHGAIEKLQTVWAAGRWQRTDEYYNRSGWAGRWTDDNGQPVFDGPATNALSHVVHASLFLSGAKAEDWGHIDRVRGCLRKARPIESYDVVFLEAVTDADVSVRLAFSHATQTQEEIVLRCQGEKGTAELEWSGTVRIMPTGKPVQESRFTCDPHYISMLNFLRAVRETDSRPFTTLNDCRPYLQIVNGALQSSGGAPSFDAGKVSRAEMKDGSRGYFAVEGLDVEFHDFSENPSRIPEQLAPGDWLDTDKIKTHLATEVQPAATEPVGA